MIGLKDHMQSALAGIPESLADGAGRMGHTEMASVAALGLSNDLLQRARMQDLFKGTF
jgi:hypothetical protein